MNKTTLLEAVKKNRTLHEANYKEACATFHKKVLERLQSMLQEAEVAAVDEPFKIPQHVNLVVPMTQLKDYDRAIAMLENSIEDVIELDANEFNQYVLDEWHWKTAFTNSTMNYTNNR